MSVHLCFSVMKFNGLVAWLGMFSNGTFMWLRTYVSDKHARNKAKASVEVLI